MFQENQATASQTQSVGRCTRGMSAMHQDSQTIVTLHAEVDAANLVLTGLVEHAKSIVKELKKLKAKRAAAVQQIDKALVTPRLSHLPYLLDVASSEGSLKKQRAAKALLKKHSLLLGTLDKKAGCFRVKLDPAGFSTAGQALRALERVLPFIGTTKGECQVLEVVARRSIRSAFRREIHITESGSTTLWRYGQRGAPLKLDEKATLAELVTSLYGDKPARKSSAKASASAVTTMSAAA